MKAKIMPSRMTFETTLVTTPIVSLSICPKPQMTRAVKPTRPARVARSTGCMMFMRCHRAVMMMPANVATSVARSIGMKTSVGVAAPYEARKARMLVGMMVSPEVLSTKNIIMGLVAVSFLLLSSCICCMALRPVGVAALSSPSMFEAIFMNMLPMTGWLRGISGKSLVKTGLSRRARRFTAPAFSPMRITPSHRASTPVRPSEISKAVLEVSKVESTIF